MVTDFSEARREAATAEHLEQLIVSPDGRR
jgi:hypothetical protein